MITCLYYGQALQQAWYDGSAPCGHNQELGCLPAVRLSAAGVESRAQTQGSGDERHGRKTKAVTDPDERKHPARRKVPSAVNSRVPLGLWASVWDAHRQWLAKEDGYDHWCRVCQEGGHLLKCDSIGCTAVQHAACSTPKDVNVSPWVCEDCWLMIGLGKLQLENIPTGITSTKVQSCWEYSGDSDDSQEEEDIGVDIEQLLHTVHESGQDHQKRNHKLPGIWSTGKWVQNESVM